MRDGESVADEATELYRRFTEEYRLKYETDGI